MELPSDLNNKILKIINKYYNNKDTELEIRFGRNKIINSNIFDNILKKLLFNKENNGYGLELNMSISLDINDDNTRISINNLDSIKKLQIQDYDIDYSCMTKKNIEKLDINNYNIRISLSKENDNSITQSELEKILNNNKIKFLRYKKRYSIKSYDNNFRYDLTVIKSYNTKNIYDNKIFKENNEYEIEAEYIGNLTNEDDLYKSLINNTNIILQLYNNSNIIIDTNEIKNIESEYKKLIKDSKLNFIAKNPVTLEKKDLIKLKNNYAVSYKADGERNFIYISSNTGELYLINKNFNILKIGIKVNKLKGTLIEGEYIDTKNILLAYDLLYFDNKDIRKLNYNSKDGDSRIKLLNLVLNEINNKSEIIDEYKSRINMNDIMLITLKKIEFTSEKTLYKNISNLLDTKNIGYNTDGLIFTPIMEEYPSGSATTWSSVFKWKPEHLNSIDFLVKFEDNNINLDKNTNKQYKTLILYVNNKNKESKFSPIKYKKDGIEKANIQIDINKKIYAYDETTNVREEIKNNTIVEFVYKYTDSIYYWTPIRIRHDKTNIYRSGTILGTMNAITTANNIWNNINNPITEEMIRTGLIESINENKEGENITNDSNYYKEFKSNENRSEYRLYNNFVKTQIIKKSSDKDNSKLLDLASGQGGDMMKWIHSKNIESVIGIDISKNDIETAKDRYNKYTKDNKININYIWGDSSKLMFPDYNIGLDSNAKKLLKELIPLKNSFDIISLQFVLHYFFKDETSFYNIMNNISNNLKIGGYFIGTCFDGNKVDKLLQLNNEHIEYLNNDIVLFKIIKKYKDNLSFTKNKSNFGSSIDVFIESIGTSFTEYLVNFKFLEDYLSKIGFKKVYIKNFKEFEKDFNKDYNKSLTDAEKKLSYLNNAFIFQKTKDIDIDKIKIIKT